MYSNVFHFVNLKLLLYNNNSSFIRRYAKRDNEIRQRAGALSAPFGVCWQIGDTKKKGTIKGQIGGVMRQEGRSVYNRASYDEISCGFNP